MFNPLIKIIVATLVVFLLGELGARAYLWQPAPDADIGNIRYGLNATAMGDYHPGQDGVYITQRSLPYYVRTNAQGFRNRRDVSSGSFLILALGDSQTYGLFMNSQDVWTDWLEHYLRIGGSSRVQVLNNGIAGSTISDQLAYFREKGRQLKPNLVLIAANPNDLGDLENTGPIGAVRQSGIAIDRDVEFSALRWFLGHNSAFYVLAKRVKEKFFVEQLRRHNREVADKKIVATETGRAARMKINADLPKSRDRYEVEFKSLVMEVRTLGGNVALAVLPDPSQIGAMEPDLAVQDFFLDQAARQQVPALDIARGMATSNREDIFLVRDGDEGDYPSDGHFSRTGHMLVARMWADFLFSQNLVPK